MKKKKGKKKMFIGCLLLVWVLVSFRTTQVRRFQFVYILLTGSDSSASVCGYSSPSKTRCLGICPC